MKCNVCEKEIPKDAVLCPYCGRKTLNSSKKKNIIIKILQIGEICCALIFLSTIIYLGFRFLKPEIFSKEIPFEEYQELNIIEINKAYKENEVTARDSYKQKHYYFTGKITNIGTFLSDNYIDIDYKYENNKTIEISAYFDDKETLTYFKNGETITVYCDFDDKSLFDGYTFRHCKVKL